MKQMHLLPGREKRVLQGHKWIFNNEITEPVREYEPGSWIEIYTSRDVLLGSGYVNPKSLIAARLVCNPGQKPTEEFFRGALKSAAERRSAVYYPGSDCYRVVYGESDGLPGLIVDRYGDVLVCQMTTLGMSRMEPLLREILRDVFHPAALVYRNDAPVRRLEGLPLEKGLAFGELPEQLRVNVDGVEFIVDPLEGQKTGLYLDQRDNRRELRRWVKGKNVLDLFCYGGAWGIAAASAGAARVVGVDESAGAVGQANLNAEINGVGDRCEFKKEEAFRFLAAMERGIFDLIILDPPAFAKTRSALPDALKGYTDLNRRALLHLKPGGILATCSCSYHMSEELFVRAILMAAQAAGRQLRLLEARGQAMDHPVLLAMPETRYLKCFFLEVI